jgi:aspartyl aminopeptidase
MSSSDGPSLSDFLCSNLNLSPTPAHFISIAITLLASDGYLELKESDSWSAIPPKFFVVRDGRSLIAVNQLDFSSGLIVGSHIDSPGLHLCPNSFRSSGNVDEVRVSPYGRTTWFEWLDRRLGAAGRALYRSNGGVRLALFQLPESVGIIPSIAVHLSRQAGMKPNFDFDKNFKVVLSLSSAEPRPPSGEAALLRERIAAQIKVPGDALIDYDVTFYDANPTRRIGIQKNLIAGSRLSNLLGALIALKSFVAKKRNSGVAALALFDDGFGGGGRTGAGSNFLSSVFARMGAPDGFFQRALFVGVDAWDSPGVYVDGPPGLAQKVVAIVPAVTRAEGRGKAVGQEIDRVVAEAIGIQAMRAGIGVQGRLNIRELVRVQDVELCSELFDGIFESLFP